jgi:hypothetical protein
MELSQSIEIKSNTSTVFDYITTPSTWLALYPSTIGVGGVTDRPIKEKDLIIEKFLINNIYYAAFQYDILKRQEQKFIEFEGKIITSTYLINFIFGSIISDIRGTFTYILENVTSDTVKFTRNLKIFSNNKNPSLYQKLLFKIFILSVNNSLINSGIQYLNAIKSAIETNTLH